jgi:hypothetical protein
MSGAPWQASMGAAQAAQAPWQAGYNVLNQSGIFDKLNGLFKGGGGGDARTPGFFDPSQYYG